MHNVGAQNKRLCTVVDLPTGAGVLTVNWKAMFALWKRELTRGNCCADTLIEAGGFNVF